MELHIGTKIIKAVAMTRGEYNSYRGWTLPSDENGSDAGFLVEYVDGGPTNDRRHSGYVSWSPADVFARAYRSTKAMNFGHAVTMLKEGYKVARDGWNGKGMFLYYVPAASYPAQRNEHGTMIGVFPDDMVPYQAYIAMKTAQDTVVPWLASQSDVLAEDWTLTEEQSNG